MSKKFTKEEFVIKANLIHKNKYNYSKVNYINSSTKIIIICIKHGEFVQEPHGHLKGNECPDCTGNRKITNKIFIERSNKIHNYKYIYNKTEYKNNRTNVIITCPEHGDFKQIAYSHMNGIKCPFCAGVGKLNNNTFIEKSNKVHYNRYIYEKINYINNRTKVIIICKEHGEFTQEPLVHIYCEAGCPKCNPSSSNIELKWLDNLNIPNDKYRQYKLKIGNKLIMVDAYDPNTNTIYEFYGDYWHGNPKKYESEIFNKSTNTTFGELYKKTMKREELIRNAGYNLITKWELDFKNEIL